MCWQCDNPDKTQADYFDVLREDIAAHGWIIQYVESDRMPYAYTVGLHALGLPEFLTSGLDPKRAIWLLDAFVRRALAGHPAIPGSQVRLPAGTQVELIEIDHPDAHMETAVRIEGRDIRAIQLVWADDRGRWPWAVGFDDGRQLQAVLGIRGAHQFGGPNA